MTIRHDWTKTEAEALFALPFADLIFQAQAAHREYFDANRVQKSTLLSIKTGGCPEDCSYCSQSSKFDTGLKASKLMDEAEVLEAARAAKAAGASRFCMGAAWRNPKDRDLDKVCGMVESVAAMGLETCATLGMLTRDQADRLKSSGLHYYNHNLDTSEEHYDKIVTTRSYADRLDTLDHVRDAGIKVCCGGHLGLGETRTDRVSMLVTLATMATHPESVPINQLMRIDGTPMQDAEAVDPLDFVRMIAVAEIMMPASVIRLSAGRENIDPELQALCFLAGAGSIFVGPKLLTTANPKLEQDDALFAKLGILPAEADHVSQGGAGRVN